MNKYVLFIVTMIVVACSSDRGGDERFPIQGGDIIVYKDPKRNVLCYKIPGSSMLSCVYVP